MPDPTSTPPSNAPEVKALASIPTIVNAGVSPTPVVPVVASPAPVSAPTKGTTAPPATTKVAAPAPTAAQALVHLDEVETRLTKDFSGKAGHNPFFFIHNHITPLRVKLQSGDATAEDITKALALPKDHVPTVDTKATPVVKKVNTDSGVIIYPDDYIDLGIRSVTKSLSDNRKV